jgi:deoxyadenosine/deoxycytidine kinase/ribonuclease HI
MNSIILSIDGNIGSGKSTLYNKLQTHYKDRKDICFVPEPVDDWKDIVDHNKTPILTNLYKDIKKYAFRFQMMAYISRLNLLRKAIKKNYKIIITERCVQTDRNVFAKMLYDDGNIDHDEYQIYNKWFYEFLDEINIAGIIYIKANPEICDQRVKNRAREGETIPLEYLQKCHIYHENWLCNEHNKLVINANVNIYDNCQVQTEWINMIDKWIREDILQLENNYSYLLQFDGACRGNPSEYLGLGCILYKDGKKKETKKEKLRSKPKGTNNQAEYLSLIMGLNMAIENNIEELLVQGDSELIINQINGLYKIKDSTLKKLYNNIKEKLGYFKKITFQHIKREFNKEADKLANEALDEN